jgi:hypothetical protein
MQELSLSVQELSLRMQELRIQELSQRVHELSLWTPELSLRAQELSLRVQELKPAPPLAILLALAAAVSADTQTRDLQHLGPPLDHGPCQPLTPSMKEGTLPM